MTKNVKPLFLFVIANFVANCSSTITFAQSGESTSQLPNHRVKHTDFIPAKPSDDSLRGQKIFQRSSCIQCHSVQSKGGCLGPVMDGVGGRRTTKFMTDRITEGGHEEDEFRKLYGSSELMPHPRLQKGDAKLVVSYLMTLAEPKGGFKVKGHSLSSDSSHKNNRSTSKTKLDKDNHFGFSSSSNQSIQVGKKLFFAKGCMSCHSVGKVGGQFATALDDVGSRKGRDYITKQMNGAELLTLGTNDEYGERGTEMPPSNLTPSQINSITDYLMSLSVLK
ncbi:hypothetical protein BH10CYA1_BH10CYA1_13730 [soil metagenome]